MREQEDEEAVIRTLEERRSNLLTAEDREAVARPTQAGDFHKPWDGFRVAQRIFKDEADEIDRTVRDKNDKKNFGARTRALREWWKTLPQQQKEEAETVAAKWNASGASKEKQAAYVYPFPISSDLPSAGTAFVKKT